jgi:phenylacetate-CoA ligase
MSPAKTSLAEQTILQKRWRLRPAFDSAPVPDSLLKNEFRAPEELKKQSQACLRALLSHCYANVPYYRKLFAEMGLYKRDLKDPGLLARLPILNKQTLTTERADLQAERLMPGQRRAGQTQTSGTTGEPTIVLHSDLSLGMFNWLKQRELRWFGWDPAASLLLVRPPIELPGKSCGSKIAAGEQLDLPVWPGVGELFVTGQAFAFSNTSSIALQRDELERRQAAYLLMQASGLEHLSLQEISNEAREKLRGALAISQTLTARMRIQVEASLKIPVQQNYGLNEIGLVASRCPEAGRYHVHGEHCWVEIVNDDGVPCQPGEPGRLLITSLNNSAMPLLRYDADDMAEPADGPCPCGRSLPAFVNLRGRYRRTAFLPEGSWQRWAAIQLALYKIAQQHPGTVQRYQMQQDQRGDFELRIDCQPDQFEAIKTVLLQAFATACPDLESPNLKIISSTEFLYQDARKFQNFVSAFMPPEDQ